MLYGLVWVSIPPDIVTYDGLECLIQEEDWLGKSTIQEGIDWVTGGGLYTLCSEATAITVPF